jgi:hypothetical protein
LTSQSAQGTIKSIKLCTGTVETMFQIIFTAKILSKYKTSSSVTETFFWPCGSTLQKSLRRKLTMQRTELAVAVPGVVVQGDGLQGLQARHYSLQQKNLFNVQPLSTSFS